MAFAVLKNVTTGNDFGASTTLSLPRTERIVVQVANAAVLYELDQSEDGRGVWSSERFLGPTVGTFGRRCSGIRFRSALAGAPAQVSCELLDRDEVAAGDSLSAFTQYVGSSGSTGGTLSMQTADVFYSAAATRDGAVLCDGSHYDAVADPSFENLWNAIGLTFGGASKSDFAVPDLAGRTIVGTGPNAAVNAVGKNDGVAAASRRGTKHRHTPHTHVAGNSTTATGPGGVAVRDDLPGAVATSSADGGSGTGTDPLDGGAFLVLNPFIVK